MAFAPVAWMVGALLALMMFLIAPINVVLGSYETRIIPAALVGRVSSAIDFGIGSIRRFGPLAAGFLASLFSSATAIVIVAGVLAAIAASMHLADGLRVLDQPIEEVTAGQRGGPAATYASISAR
ncbi:hypothetical protein E1286_25185 [Nonomuraea terrae]|uniref:MFS transporter n=1 Tax=Nonomuraea terrae TaxID=2530383 RepID=A0A4R4YLR1_9ACTN|nr:hypothetical protein [Nonomuraea terrae]TDD45029.1 hypothetical protein E1286_25185 [Nonomuraea terrae]